MKQRELGSTPAVDTGEVAPVRTVVFGRGPDRTATTARVVQVAHHRSDDAAFADALVARLGGTGDPSARAYGTLSFRRDQPAGFVIPQHDGAGPARTSSRRTAVVHRRELPVPDAYAGRVATALERLAAEPRLGKIVLGRWLELTAAAEVDPVSVLAGLGAGAGSAYLFCLPPEAVAGSSSASLVGASPELLVSRRGRQVRSTPLAGSIPRSADPDEDARRAASLSASAKDQHEHAFVVASIAEALRPICADLDVPSEPHLVATDTMWHLATDIRGALLAGDGPRPSALHLAQLLHPTPAVCGSPRELAADLIAELETEPRGPMTGCVGWVDAAGDGEFAVTIRSALVDGRSVRLFAGAGIVPGSDPAAEVAETEAKLQTVLRALEAP